MKTGQVVKYRDASGVERDATVSGVGESGLCKILDLHVNGETVTGVSHAKDSKGSCWWLPSESAPESPAPRRRRSFTEE